LPGAYERYGNRAIVGNALTFNANNNRITTAGYTYDAVGNLTNDSTQALAYDAENKIIKVNNVSAYVYDGEGQRVRKLVVENLRFIYGIGGNLIAEFDRASGALKKEYIYGASGLAVTIEPTAINANGTRYTTSDHLGSPRVITDSGAIVKSRHDYKPFGEEIGAGIGARTEAMGYLLVSDGLRQKFTSKERDNETGLDYFGARYYARTQGRFTSPDLPFMDQWELNPQSWNLYSYVRNNPLRLVDPTGNAAEDLCDKVCHDSKKRAEEERKKAEAEGIDVEVIEMKPPAQDRTYDPSMYFVNEMARRTAPIEPLGHVGVAIFSVLPLTGPAMWGSRLLGIGAKQSGKAAIGSRIAFRSVDDLIAAAGKLKTLRHGEELGRVKGNANEILEALAQSYGAKVTTRGSTKFFQSGELRVTLYRSTSEKLPTLQK
jgi:RHS repeat-associated protein